MEKPYGISSSFGNYCFEDNDIIVEYIHDDLPEIREDMVEIVGGNGSVLRSLHLGPRTITLDCRAFKEKWHDFDELKDELAAVLLCGTEKVLSLRNHFGEWYMAHFTGFSEGDREGGTGIGGFTLTFVASDPIRYGRIREATIPESGRLEFDVTGTYRTDISVTCPNAKRSESSKVWGLRFDDGDRLHVPIPSAMISKVEIGSNSRAVRVNGKVSMITLDSDWPVLEAGTHEVRLEQGTGDVTIRWQERIL